MEHTFLTPRGQPATFQYRADTNDWNTLYSCLVEDEYGLGSLNLSGWAIDIGGYLGAVGIGLALDNPGLRVLIVEPVPSNVTLIGWAIAANGLSDRVTLVDGAAGAPRQRLAVVSYGYEGTPELEHHANVGNSTLANENRGPIKHKERRVKPYSLGKLLDMTGGSAALLKIDCEGCEWGVLSDPAVSRIERIVGEVHPTNGHSPLHMAALLSETHDVTFSGPPAGPCGFEAVRRG